MTFGRCRFIGNWPEWDCSIHMDDAQVGRQGRAMTYPFTFEINTEARTARFSSTSELPYYDTSLSKCNCHDFQTRHLPCKHMYRLAVELGVIEIIRRQSSGGGMNKDLLAEVKSSEDVDSHPEQIKRIEKAKGAKMAPLSVDRENQTALFLGSGKKPYETTLTSCTCRDYLVRRLPCKHIYRLRMELNQEHFTDEAQLSLEAFHAPKSPASSSAISMVDVIGASIGCCSHYRECSSTGHCVVPDRDYAASCLYRKNLKAGRVYYGETANAFSAEEYASYKYRVESLSPESRTIFDRLLILFCEYNRGVRSVIVHNSAHLKELSDHGLFSFEHMGANFPPRKSEQWNYQKILDPVLSNVFYAPLFQNAQSVRAEELRPLRTSLKEARDRKDAVTAKRLSSELSTLYKSKPGEHTKEFLYQWLNSEVGVPLRNELAAPYRIAVIPSLCSIYAEEFYRSNLLNSYDQRTYWNTPYYVDGLLSPSAAKAEEERRIRLSPGYTPEEKEALLSALAKVTVEMQYESDVIFDE